MTPGAYRKRRPPAGMPRRRRINAETLTHLLCMEPEIREIESFVVAGVRERFDEETKRRIPAPWGRCPSSQL